MNFCEKTTARFNSSNKQNQIKYFVYTPKSVKNGKQPKGMLQLVHGMAEHIERYEPYIDFLTSKGYLVYGDNHLGHKGSVTCDEDLGYFADRDGWKYLIEDEVQLTQIMKEKYPDLPVYLYGHSMGSFITRLYMVQYAALIDGVIISGTAGKNRGVPVLISLTKFLSKMRGIRYRSNLVNQLMFGPFNSKYKEVHTGFDWLTQDAEIVHQYVEDPYGGFTFTYGGFYDLQMLLQQVTADTWYNKIPVQLPMLIISGEQDPVGNWGKGIKEIDQKIKQLSCQDYEMRLFPNMRHEIHNELEKQQVWDYVVSWLDNRCKAEEN